MITEKNFRDICARLSPGSHPLQSYLTAFTCEAGLAMLERYKINTPVRLAAFFGNVLEETGGFTVIRESMNYTHAERIAAVWDKRFTITSASRYVRNARALANTVYGGRLGNEVNGTDDDDGFNFRGGGPLQATGRGFYLFLSHEMGVDFVGNPQEIENPDHWVEMACLTWRKHPSAGDLNTFADQGNYKGCCLGINYGNGYVHADPIGWAERQKWHNAFTALLNAPAAAAAASGSSQAAEAPVAVYTIGSPYNDAVRLAQARLNALGYAKKGLREDGLYGPNTFSAVSDFQHINGMEMTGVMTASVLAVIMSSAAKPWPVPAEAVMGIDGLRASGDAGVKAADGNKVAAMSLVGATAIEATAKTGMLDFAVGLSKDASAWQAALSALTTALTFVLQHATMVAAIVVAIVLWRWYGNAIMARVALWTRPTAQTSVIPALSVGPNTVPGG